MTISPNLGGLEPFAVEPKKVDKPWGHELIWALTDDYCGKLLFVKAGESLSLQFHRQKDESWLVHSGRVELEMAEAGKKLPDVEVVGPGAAFDPAGNRPSREGARRYDDHRGLDAAARGHRPARGSVRTRVTTSCQPTLTQVW